MSVARCQNIVQCVKFITYQRMKFSINIQMIMNKKNKIMIKQLHGKNFKIDNKYNNKKINIIKRLKNKKKVELKE